MEAHDLHSMLLRDEGMRLGLYVLNGIPHIGMGHNLRDVPIPLEVAELLAKYDTADAVRDINTQSWARLLPDARHSVLVNMRFCLGMRGLMDFVGMIAAIRAGDFARAAAEIRDSEFYRSTVTHDRAERLARQMESDTWV
jgi:lysozyme